MSATGRIASFAVETRTEALPSWTVETATRCLVNLLGVALHASSAPSSRALLTWCESERSAGRAAVIGHDVRLGLRDAALVNGFQAHLDDYDDTHFPSVLHPSAVVWPAVLAHGAAAGCSGREALAAFVLGAEVACRVAMSVHPWHYDQGWHITATAGVFGAAAAAARLTGLDAERTRHALGIAGTQAHGVRVSFGSAAKAAHAGGAASIGVAAAGLAALGYTGATDILEGRRGFWEVLSAAGHSEAALLDGLGERFELARNGLKPYPCGVVIHPLQDAAIALRARHGFAAAAVESVHAEVHPLVLELVDRVEPASGLESKFSYQHGVAAALVHGAGYPAQFSDACAVDPEVAGLRRRIVATVTPGIAEDETRLTVRLVDGRRLEMHVEHARGSPDNPLDDAEVDEKFAALAAPVLGEAGAARLLAEARGLARAPDLGALCGALSSAPGVDPA